MKANHAHLGVGDEIGHLQLGEHNQSKEWAKPLSKDPYGKMRHASAHLIANLEVGHSIIERRGAGNTRGGLSPSWLHSSTNNS